MLLPRGGDNTPLARSGVFQEVTAPTVSRGGSHLRLHRVFLMAFSDTHKHVEAETRGTVRLPSSEESLGTRPACTIWLRSDVSKERFSRRRKVVLRSSSCSWGSSRASLSTAAISACRQSEGNKSTFVCYFWLRFQEERVDVWTRWCRHSRNIKF